MKKILYLGVPLLALVFLAGSVSSHGNDLFVRGNFVQGGTVKIFGYALPNSWVGIQVNSPVGVYFIDQVKANQYGFFKTEFTLNNNAPTGTYKIYVASRHKGTRKVYFYLFPKVQKYHKADTNKDCRISDTELLNLVTLWRNRKATTGGLISAINIWRTHKAYC